MALCVAEKAPHPGIADAGGASQPQVDTPRILPEMDTGRITHNLLSSFMWRSEAQIDGILIRMSSCQINGGSAHCGTLTS